AALHSCTASCTRAVIDLRRGCGRSARDGKKGRTRHTREALAQRSVETGGGVRVRRKQREQVAIRERDSVAFKKRKRNIFSLPRRAHHVNRAAATLLDLPAVERVLRDLVTVESSFGDHECLVRLSGAHGQHCAVEVALERETRRANKFRVVAI